MPQATHDDQLLPRGIVHEEFGVNSDVNIRPTPGPSNVRPVTPERQDADQSLGRPLNLTEERRVNSDTDSLPTPETPNAPRVTLERRDADIPLHTISQPPTATTWQTSQPSRLPGFQESMAIQGDNETRGLRPSHRRPELREVLIDPDLPNGFVDYTQVKNLYRRTRRRRVLRFFGVTHESENRGLAYPWASMGVN
ncbi:hypothetical protein CPB85DRAFT_301249 [Mucidula mucida]|nr:hypothetical protein CPB85DRAFT_301249 [Mucidula mucida]